METNEVFTHNQYGERLAGLVDTPDTYTGPMPTIILVHGLGGEKREQGLFDMFAQFLTDHGYITYRFDFSGAGDSQGVYWKNSVSRATQDLQAIVDFVVQQLIVDTNRIGMMPISLGCTMTLMLNADQIKAYVMLGIPANLLASAKQSVKSFIRPKTSHGRSLSKGITLKQRARLYINIKAWRDNLKHSNLLPKVAQIHKPICFIHGEHDSKTPLQGARDAYDIANDPKELVIIEGSDHAFYQEHERRQMLEHALTWFKKYL